MLSHAAFVNVLKSRYDHYSSPIMAKELLAGAGLEPKESYEKSEIERLVEAVKGLGDGRNGILVARLEELLGGGGKAEQKAEPPMDARAEVAPEQQGEPQGEDKAEDKGDDKAEDKGEDKKSKKKK